MHIAAEAAAHAERELLTFVALKIIASGFESFAIILEAELLETIEISR